MNNSCKFRLEKKLLWVTENVQQLGTSSWADVCMLTEKWFNISKLLENLMHHFPSTPPAGSGVVSHRSACLLFPQSLYFGTVGE